MLKGEEKGISHLYHKYRCTITKGVINIIWPGGIYSPSWSGLAKWVDKNELMGLVNLLGGIEIDLEIDKKNGYLPIVKFKRIR